MFNKTLLTFCITLLYCFHSTGQTDFLHGTKKQKDSRMEWWREARFGMFIHWGLYSIPAGEWKGTTNHAEWIRTTAQIPLKEYDQFLRQFNPIGFNAEDWVRMAKEAGMKYITITSKHHDGFCLWDSKETDFDVMNTLFKRDILKELSEACKKIGGIKLCFYHSIMDWHHPDYNERRDWEKDRSTEGTDRKRYINYMKNQLKELLTNYGEIGVLWFDGEWEGFWTHEDGKDLYKYVRSLQPNIIINNRVDKGRSGMAGMTTEGDFAGDFGTPEQEIPETGLPGVDWESCMTMNNNWGYNKADKNFKSSGDLIQKLVDIASKGGNFLLNIGPKADGTFPQESIDRLRDIGNWMKVNGESIYGTTASPFEHINWGRVTRKSVGEFSTLFLHIFDWPANNKIELNGIGNDKLVAHWMEKRNKVDIQQKENRVQIQLDPLARDSFTTVIELHVHGNLQIYKPPLIRSYSDHFVNPIEVELIPMEKQKNVVVRYTIDGTDPIAGSRIFSSKILLSNNTTLKAASFIGLKRVSEIVEKKFTKVAPESALKGLNVRQDAWAFFYEGEWDRLPDFNNLAKKGEGNIEIIGPGIFKGKERYGIVIEGYIKIPVTDVYNFYLSSDDGSRMYLNEKLLIDNDGLHGMVERKGTIGLTTGYHKFRIEFFERTGGDDLKLFIESSKMKKQELPRKLLFH